MIASSRLHHPALGRAAKDVAARRERKVERAANMVRRGRDRRGWKSSVRGVDGVPRQASGEM
jgi:hypothetical protein